MNADTTGTRDAHLDLEDLIAGASGQPASGRAREHLAGCEQCQREVNRWDLVAGGIRGLAAAAPDPARPAAAPRTGRRGPAGRWRRALVVAGSAAAVFLLLIGIGTLTGSVHVHLGGSSSPPTLAAVIGCSQLQQADGTLEQVNGSSLVLKEAGGQAVTVTTTPDTFVSMSGALLGDITDGASVMVRGTTSGGTITAAVVTVGPPFSAVNPAGFVPVQGTVADAGTGGFTLVTSSGSRIPVVTSGGTLVVVPHARLGQLQAGRAVFAVGHSGPDGTLAAQGVAMVSQLPSGPRIEISVKDCSPSSVQEALGAVSAAPVS
jgi:hypothetical protein